MRNDLIIAKSNSLRSALETMQLALKEQKNEFVRDAAIQRFEYCFELSWKLLKTVIEFENGGHKMAGGIRKTIEEGVRLRLIENEEDWLVMLENRNLSVHTYNLDVAESIYNQLPSYYEGLWKFYK